MYAAYGALLSYHSLDLLNGNYMGYLITAARYAVIFWAIGSLRVPDAAGRPSAPARTPNMLQADDLRAATGPRPPCS